MKRIYPVIVAFFLALITCDTTAQVKQKYFGRTGRNEVTPTSIVLKNGNRVAVGYAYSGTTVTGADALAVCFDTANNILWSKELSTANTDVFVNAVSTTDTGFVAVGYAVFRTK
jgi:hypothetical protein